METRSKSAQGQDSSSKADPRCIKKERDVHNHAEDTAEPPRKIAIVRPMGLQCKTDPWYKLRFKVLMSSYSRFKTLIETEGDPRVKRARDELFQHMFMHPTIHAHYMYMIHHRCIMFLNAVQDASKDYRSPCDNVDVRGLADIDFDVWLTIEMDQSLQTETRVEASPQCSQNKKRVLTEGTVEYDMEKVWEPMKHLLYYTLCFASSH